MVDGYQIKMLSRAVCASASMEAVEWRNRDSQFLLLLRLLLPYRKHYSKRARCHKSSTSSRQMRAIRVLFAVNVVLQQCSINQPGTQQQHKLAPSTAKGCHLCKLYKWMYMLAGHLLWRGAVIRALPPQRLNELTADQATTEFSGPHWIAASGQAHRIGQHGHRHGQCRTSMATVGEGWHLD